MEHIRVREYHVRAFPNSFPRILRRVPVIRERLDVRSHRIDDRLEFVQLILGQRLGRKRYIARAPGSFTNLFRTGRL